MRRLPTLPLLLVLAAASVALAACAAGSTPSSPATPGPQPTASPAASPVLLVSVEAKGGECPEGTCSVRYDVFRDGRVERSDGQVDRFDEDTAARLAASIDGADWDAILARPFTGECPTAYDGQELVYTFQAARGTVLVSSCAVQIDPGQEPFATLSAALFGGG